MIGIKLDGDNEFLDTPEDVSISVRLENPIFSQDDKISPGSYSFPFTLPAGNVSPSNAAKLRHPDVMANNEAYQINKATLFINNLPFKNGNLKVNESDRNKLSAYFTFGLSSIDPSFKTAKLRDIVSEAINIPVNCTKEIYVRKIAGGDDWAITVNGILYEGEHLAIVVGKINGDGQGTADTGQWVPRIQVIDTDHAKLDLVKWFWGVDMFDEPILIPAVSTNPADHELSVDVDPIITQYEVSCHLDGYYATFNTFLADYPDGKIAFPIFFNANAYNGKNLKISEIVNGIHSGGGLLVNDPNWGYNNIDVLDVKNTNSLQPFVFLKAVLDKIAEHFAFELEGDFLDEPDYENMLIDNSSSLDVPFFFAGYIKEFVFWQKSFNVSDLVPDLSVVDFFKALQSRYNLAIYFNEATKKVRIQKRESIANSLAYEDVTPISSPIEKIEDLGKISIALRLPKDASDAFAVEETAGFLSDQEYTVQCGRLYQETFIMIDDGLCSGPRISRPNQTSFSFRIFHYKGLVDNGEFEYHGASIHGTEITESLPDVHAKFWVFWLMFELRRKAIKLSVNFPLRKILLFDYELKRRFDRSNYLIKSIDLTITNKAFQVSKVELYSQM